MRHLLLLQLVLLLLLGCKVEGDATVSGSESFDTEAPKGVRIVTADGGTSITATPASFEISAKDNEGLAAYLLSTDSTTPLVDSKNWVNLKGTPKSKTVTLEREYTALGKETLYLWFKDTSDNISNRVSQTFTVDIWPGSISFATIGVEDAKTLLQDAAGNLILLFESAGNYDRFTGQGGSDIYLVKLNSLGAEVWSRQFGGSGDETLESALLDAAGDLVFTGSTTSSLSGTNAGGTDFFAAKYSAQGSSVWLRQIGSTADDVGRAISEDASGDLVFAGDFAADFSNKVNRGGTDVFVLRLSSGGKTQWLKRLATTGDDQAWGLANSRTGATYILGTTDGSFAGTTALGGDDCLLAKLDANGNELWVRQFGTTSADRCNQLRLQSDGSVFLAAQTQGAFGDATNQGGQDVALLKYNSQGQLKKSLQLGTSALDEVNGLYELTDGSFLLTGTTYGSLGGTHAGGGDAFMAAVTADFTLDWTSQIGGTGLDEGKNLVEDSLGNLVWAVTSASSFEDITHLGSGDAILLKTSARGAVK